MNSPATILIVDDLEANRDTLRELLDIPDYRLLEAASGPAALRMAMQVLPDLVLLDVMMPGMDGFEVCRHLRADSRLGEVPVVMITALDDQASRLAGIEAGADDFISKPFNRLELRARVRTIARLNRYRRLHEAQAALRDSEKHFRALFALGPIAVYSCDADGTIQDFNDRAAALWGRKPEPADREDRYCGSIKMFDPDGTWVPHEQSPMAKVCRGEIPSVEGQEYLIERPNRSRVTVIVSIVPLRNDRGEITCAIASFHDITARKVAELALRENEQWLKAIFDQASVCVAQLDAKTARFVRFNQRFCQFLGYSADEMARMSPLEITHGADLELDLEKVRQLRAGLIREYSREKRFIRKNGAIVWASMAVSAIGVAEGIPTAFVTVVLDITERKRLDEHFLQAQKMEALGQFSGGVAHDFNNILAVIGGYTELSQMILKENPEVRENLGAALKATGRATDLVRQILAFSRHEAQEKRPVRLETIVAESFKLLRATIPATVEFEQDLASDAPAALGNANQIHQILTNLGINAWHAMKDRPGRIRASVESIEVDADFAAMVPRLRKGGYVRVSIGDNGSGMDAATMRRVFEPFFTTKPLGEGTGLGLSVVYGIMDSHDGAVTVESELGQGTVFRLYFPAHEGEAAAEPAEDRSIPRGHGERVLVIDDEELLALLLQKTLSKLGYQAESATDPVEALARVRADPGRFKLVLSDQTMPGMTGLVLAAELKLIRADLPVILMTGYSKVLTAERVARAGVQQLILKPITIHTLGTAVGAAIASKVGVLP